jgi:hypothetical protein
LTIDRSVLRDIHIQEKGGEGGDEDFSDMVAEHAARQARKRKKQQAEKDKDAKKIKNVF